MITAFAVLVALAVLAWGFYRARPFGKLGIFAWLQSVVLMVPWLLVFGLVSLGIDFNLAGVLLLLVASSGLYIFLGNRLRSMGQDELLRQRAAAAIAQRQQAEQAKIDSDSAPTPNGTPTEGEDLSIPTADLQLIKSIFGVDTFFATETIPFQDGAIFRGNLRGETETSFAKLSDGLRAKVSDRYRLFLVTGQEEKPVVIVLPKSRDPKPSTTMQKVFAGLLMLTTIAASVESASIMVGFDFFSTPSRYAEVLPLASAIIGIFAAHEIGHWVMAKRYNVRLSWPFFIPTWQLGAFGALTRIESLLTTRSQLFDIAIAGPAAGGFVSLVLLLAGLALSHPGSIFQVPSDFFQGSILVGTLARVVLGDRLQAAIVDVNPMVVLGWLGLVVTALNVMPAGQLDGGRIVQAIYGRTVAQRTTIATLIILGLASLVNPLALYWAIVVLFLQRDLERPSLNELTEPDDARAALGLLALFLMITTLLPLTPSLAGRLGIGG